MLEKEWKLGLNLLNRNEIAILGGLLGYKYRSNAKRRLKNEII